MRVTYQMTKHFAPLRVRACCCVVVWCGVNTWQRKTEEDRGRQKKTTARQERMKWKRFDRQIQTDTEKRQTTSNTSDKDADTSTDKTHTDRRHENMVCNTQIIFWKWAIVLCNKKFYSCVMRSWRRGQYTLKSASFACVPGASTTWSPCVRPHLPSLFVQTFLHPRFPPVFFVGLFLSLQAGSHAIHS